MEGIARELESIAKKLLEVSKSAGSNFHLEVYTDNKRGIVVAWEFDPQNNSLISKGTIYEEEL